MWLLLILIIRLLLRLLLWFKLLWWLLWWLCRHLHNCTFMVLDSSYSLCLCWYNFSNNWCNHICSLKKEEGWIRKGWRRSCLIISLIIITCLLIIICCILLLIITIITINSCLKFNNSITSHINTIKNNISNLIECFLLNNLNNHSSLNILLTSFSTICKYSYSYYICFSSFKI